MSADSMSLVWKMVVVGAGGSVGTLLRFGVYELVIPRATNWWATFAVNILGCLAFGALKAAVDIADWGSLELRAFLFFGVLGAFTTFSTFEADFFGLWTEGERLPAVLYVTASVVMGLVAFVGAHEITAKLLT